MKDGTDDELILAIIQRGVMSGAYWAYEREFVGSKGFEKMALKHRAAGEWLMREICGERAAGTAAPSPRDR